MMYDVYIIYMHNRNLKVDTTNRKLEVNATKIENDEIIL